MPELMRHVALFDDKGILYQFGPGDDIPSWARKKITNPNVWDGELDDDEGGSDGPPPKSGKGGGIRAWRKYAEDNGVDVDGLDSPEEVIAAVETAGVPVE